MASTTQIDLLADLPKRIDVLDHGFVELLDSMPRLVPTGQTAEGAIVRAARISTIGHNYIQRPGEADANLLRYLFENGHTSPFEQTNVTFAIHCPMFVKNHFVRHRMPRINEFSQRYAQLKHCVQYKPSKFARRIQSSTNTQGSVQTCCVEPSDEYMAALLAAEEHAEQMFAKYERMIELGMPREQARVFLPNSTYTVFIWNIDLNNLVKFMRLRCDDHTQWETRVFADAIRDLVRPLYPITLNMYDNSIGGMFLTGAEVRFIQDRRDEEMSVRDRKKMQEKLEKLKLK